MTVPVLERLRPALAAAPWAIWGGDWNHAVNGPERAGSLAGRRAILDAVAGLGLAIPTADQPHAIDGLATIDHIALPAAWRVTSCRRVVAEADGARLSDHDAYVVEVADLMAETTSPGAASAAPGLVALPVDPAGTAPASESVPTSASPSAVGGEDLTGGVTADEPLPRQALLRSHPTAECRCRRARVAD